MTTGLRFGGSKPLTICFVRKLAKLPSTVSDLQPLIKSEEDSVKGNGFLVSKKDSILCTRDGIFSYFFQVEVASEALEIDTNRGNINGGTLNFSKEDIV